MTIRWKMARSSPNCQMIVSIRGDGNILIVGEKTIGVIVGVIAGRQVDLSVHLLVEVGAGAGAGPAPLIGTAEERGPRGIERGTPTGHLDLVSEKGKQVLLYPSKRWKMLKLEADTE